MADTPRTKSNDETAPTGRRAGLDRAEVVRAALELVEQGGAEALSMRKLAAELGVTTTTIYWHVGTHDELVVALVQLLAERLALAEIEGDAPRDRVMSAVRNIWRNALAHRNVTALASQVGATTLLELPLEVALVAELDAAGVRGDDARDALRAILMSVAGFLVGTWRGEGVVPPELRHGALWARVDDDRIAPATIAAMAVAPDIDALFERTLAAVVETFLSPSYTAHPHTAHPHTADPDTDPE